MYRRIYIRKEVVLIILLLLVIAGMMQVVQNGTGGQLKQQTESELEIKRQQEEYEGENIRVLLLSTGYSNSVHPSVQLSAPGGLKITAGEVCEEWVTSEALEIVPDDARFAAGKICVTPLADGEEICVHNINRSYGAPVYTGMLELRATAEGIAIINELPLEDYLCKVVPSEMPASYELEALKAQAVCARSYAMRQMQEYGYPEYEAHVDDSTKFQVYNNSLAQETSTQAVMETAGQVVWYQGTIAVTYYYSTSGGVTTDMTAWGNAVNESNAYLQSVDLSGANGAYEQNLPWYHWTASVPVQILSNLVGLNTGVDVGQIQDIEVTKRGGGNIAVQIVVTGDKGTVTVDTENKIRAALGGSGYSITKNDGTVTDSTKLLPSAFFTIRREGESFIIEGGGFGHGIGMSQNGANEMAKVGMDYKEILQTFYQKVTVGAAPAV